MDFKLSFFVIHLFICVCYCLNRQVDDYLFVLSSQLGIQWTNYINTTGTAHFDLCMDAHKNQVEYSQK